MPYRYDRRTGLKVWDPRDEWHVAGDESRERWLERLERERAQQQVQQELAALRAKIRELEQQKADVLSRTRIGLERERARRRRLEQQLATQKQQNTALHNTAQELARQKASGARPSNRAGHMAKTTQAILRAAGAVLYGDKRDKIPRDWGNLAARLEGRAGELSLAGCDLFDATQKLTETAAQAMLEGMKAADLEGVARQPAKGNTR
jgi:TolA-binding protein